jgi:hypothetical protein
VLGSPVNHYVFCETSTPVFEMKRRAWLEGIVLAHKASPLSCVNTKNTGEGCVAGSCLHTTCPGFQKLSTAAKRRQTREGTSCKS